MRDYEGRKIEIGDTVAFSGPCGTYMCVGKVRRISARNDRIARYWRGRGDTGFDHWATVVLEHPDRASDKGERKVGVEMNVAILEKGVVDEKVDS